MDEIREAFVGAFVSLITTAGDQAELLVVAAFAIAGAWIKTKLSAPVQRQAVLEAALETERWADNEVVAGRERPASAAKKQRAKDGARARLPMRHKPILSLGRTVEAVLPEVRRLSSPPPPEPTT